MDIKNSVLAVGLFVGSLMILSVCLAYIRGRPFGMGGIVLTVGGVMLIGLSVFSRITLSVSDEGFEARIQSIEHKVADVDQNVKMVNEANQVVSEAIQDVAKTQRTNTDKVTQLTDALASRKALQPEVAEQVRTELRQAPQVDLQRLQKFQKLDLK